MPVTDNTAKSRFELEVEGHVAFAEYTSEGNVITFTHTVVPEQLGGKGVGSKLAAGALDLVRAKGQRVVAQCPFISGYIAKKTDYQDLLK
jgi:uncharacterized protein